MSLFSGLIREVASVVNTLSVSAKEKKTDSGGFVVCREPAVGGFEPQPDSGCEGGNGRQLVAAFVASLGDVVICRHCGGRGVV